MKTPRAKLRTPSALLALSLLSATAQAQEARSWPMFGGSPGRNMVNLLEHDLPAEWWVGEGKSKNIKWSADLGDRSMGSPVVARGKVFVPTLHERSNPKFRVSRTEMMAFREADGKLLWRNVHPNPDLHGISRQRGVASTAAVDGDRIYYITFARELVCADADTGKIEWRFDMIRELNIFPSLHPSCPAVVTAPGAPLVAGDLVFAVTGNGMDHSKDQLVSPRALSFVALDKRTGKLVWQSNLPGERIIEGSWSTPALAKVDGKAQVIFAGGDCVIYSFEPQTGELLWKCDCLPARKEGERERRFVPVDNYILSAPVVVGDKLHVGLGTVPEHVAAPRSSHFLCLDITKKGNVSLRSYVARAPANQGSALVWAFGGPIEPLPKEGRGVRFGPTVSTAAVHAGFVYITEEAGYVHCLDAATGRGLWVHDLKCGISSSPYWVDGRVFVATEEGEVVIFAHGRMAQVLATIDMEDPVRTTPVAANGVLYVATDKRLYAIGGR